MAVKLFLFLCSL